MPELEPPRRDNILAVHTALHDLIHPMDPASLQGEALGDFTSFAISEELEANPADIIIAAQKQVDRMLRLDMDPHSHINPLYAQASQRLAALYERLIRVYTQDGMHEAQADTQAAETIQEITLTHLATFLPGSLRELSQDGRIQHIRRQLSMAVVNPTEPVPIEGNPLAISDFLLEKYRETRLLSRQSRFSTPKNSLEFQELAEAKFFRLKHMYTIPGYYETAQAVSQVFDQQVQVFISEEKNEVDAAYLAYMEMEALVPDEEIPY